MMARRLSGLPKSFLSVVMATVGLAAWLGVVVGAAPTVEPIAATAPAPVEDSGCLRPLSDVIWGFLVTLFACTVAVWGYMKYTLSGRGDKVLLLFMAVFAPLYGLYGFIGWSLRSAVLIWRYNKLCRNISLEPPPSRGWYGHLKMLWLWVSPFSKSQGRILFCCEIVVYVVKESALLKEDWLWAGTNVVEDESEAMVIGEIADGKTQNGHYERRELSYQGTTALMLAEVVPKYDELKFLRGNSGFAMIALAMQALGYIYAVVFRVVKDLPVAPLEVVGLTLNIVLLIEVGVFSFFNACHRPLVIYINLGREDKLLESMVLVKEREVLHNWMEKEMHGLLGVVWMCLGGIVVYFIISLSKVSSILVVLPLIIFIVESIMWIIYIVYDSIWDNIIFQVGILLSIVAYMWAFIVTIVYWKSQKFNARVELFDVSQLIPFIG